MTTAPTTTDRTDSMRLCKIDGCSRIHKGLGFCKMHYDRLRATGDPLKKSRFNSEEEKAAYIEAERAERRARQAEERAANQAETERLKILQTRGFQRIRPDAKAMVSAIDSLPPEERAAVVSLAVSVLFGRDIDLTK